MEKRYRKGEEIPLLSAVHRAERVGELVRGSRRHLEVSLPETAGETAGLTLEEVDRAVERDARRYDGGAVFY